MIEELKNKILINTYQERESGLAPILFVEYAHNLDLAYLHGKDEGEAERKGLINEITQLKASNDFLVQQNQDLSNYANAVLQNEQQRITGVINELTELCKFTMEEVGDLSYKTAIAELVILKDNISTPDPGLNKQYEMSNIEDSKNIYDRVVMATPISDEGKEMRVHGTKDSVPMTILNEEWAFEIHKQSLDTLNSRGGMSYQEIYANIKHLPIEDICKISEVDAKKCVGDYYCEWKEGEITRKHKTCPICDRPIKRIKQG